MVELLQLGAFRLCEQLARIRPGRELLLGVPPTSTVIFQPRVPLRNSGEGVFGLGAQARELSTLYKIAMDKGAFPENQCHAFP